MELLAVVLILGILSTIATNVYVGQVRRARQAGTSTIIRELETAIARYEIDLGTFPPSGSPGSNGGSGFLFEALAHSLGGNVFAPSSPQWDGPYMDFPAERISNLGTALSASSYPGLTGSGSGTFVTLEAPQILDSFDLPIHYASESSYAIRGCELFPGARPLGASPDLPENNPFFSTESHYNPVTFQLFSAGPDNDTLDDARYPGAEFDDINNYNE